MLETAFGGTTKPSVLLSFQPRQVTLANMKNKKNSSSETLEKDIPNTTLVQKLSQKEKKKKKRISKDSSLLLLSIANFLELKGFSKTLAAFKSEALIEQLDGLEGYLLDLETVYSKYSETSDKKPNSNDSGKLEEVADDSVVKLTNEASPDLPVKSKDKKKKPKLVSDLPENTQKVSLEVDEHDKEPKDKKKKKSKPTSESLVESVEQSGSAENGNLHESAAEEEKNVKSKDKKKKKNKKKTENLCEEAVDSERGDSKNTGSKKDNVSILEGNEANVEKKDSKKRKRGGSEEEESQLDDKVEIKESKQSKAKVSEEEKVKDDSVKDPASLESDEHAGKKRKMENGESDKSLKSPLNEPRSATEKSSKKQRIGSAEPKTVNAFRRVDIEKVEFVDDRLQDNSYWAKHGADVGYGAKAQEVLGQVRGKDFRHEKTKKKRGSYRGGLIDQESHSIKFNYSDEE